MAGPANLDEEFSVAPKKKKSVPVLDLEDDEEEEVKTKLNKGEVLFPDDDEEEEDEDESPKPKNRKERESKRVVREVDNETMAAVEIALGDFDPFTANKKQIRNLRKALGALSKARYPKAKKEKKVEAPKKSKKVSKK